MVAPGIHNHIILRRHMTGNALSAFAARLMLVVFGRVIGRLWQSRELSPALQIVTLRADIVAFRDQPRRMGFMTVRTTHSTSVHLRL